MTALVLSVLLAAPPPKADPATDRQLLALWADLADEDAKAARALLKLAAHPDAVAFLKVKLAPAAIDADRATKLLADLGSDDEKVWKPAYDELAYRDPRLAIDLEALMAIDSVQADVPRARLVALLSGDRTADNLLKTGKPIKLNRHQDGPRVYFNFFCEGSWWAECEINRLNASVWGNRKPLWTRAVRAVVLLEHLGTPDAVGVLKAMTTGHAEAQPTKAAKEATERLGKK